MADHVIVQVRDALVAWLKANVTSVSGRVFLPHEAPVPGEVDDTNTPYLMVRIGDDSGERIGDNGAAAPALAILEDLTVVFFVYCVTKLDGDTEQAAYNLRRDVEQALFSTVQGATLGGLVPLIRRPAAANNRDDAIDQGAYGVGIQLEVPIRHLEGAPDSFSY